MEAASAVRVRFGIAVVLAGFGLWLAPPAAALTLIETEVWAEAVESGEDPGSEFDEDQTSTPGDSISANANECPGDAFCASLPGDISGAYARAETDYGSNRAYARAPDGYDEDFENDVVDTAFASSFWADEWTFIVPLAAIGAPVSLEFVLDGSWANEGGATFGAGIFDRDAFYVRNPDDPIPFLDVEEEPVASLELSTHEETGLLFQPIAGNPIQIISIDEGGEVNGSIDLHVVMQFIPVPGRTYTVAARLVAGASSDLDSSIADFESTGELVRVVVPDGVSFSSAAGAQWNVEVPEPSAAALLGLALLLRMGLRRP